MSYCDCKQNAVLSFSTLALAILTLRKRLSDAKTTGDWVY